MSADRWSVCPRCKDTKEKEYSERVDAVAKMYGKVPAEEYEQAKKDLFYEEDFEETVREDYEIGIWENKFFVSYSAHCTSRGCNFVVKFNHSEALPSDSESETE